VEHEQGVDVALPLLALECEIGRLQRRQELVFVQRVVLVSNHRGELLRSRGRVLSEL
jgi:hypothetical protein